MDDLILLLMFWLFCLTPVSWFVQYKLYKLLEKYHYEKWVWLGPVYLWIIQRRSQLFSVFSAYP